MGYKYFIDKIDQQGVAGWIYLEEAPEKSIQLKIEVNGKQIASITADRPRTDLIEKKIGNGHCSFLHDLSDVVGVQSEATISLKIADSDLLVASHKGDITKPYTSSFGGFWIDRRDFLQEAARRYNGNLISNRFFHHCMDLAVKGYTVFPKLVSDELIDQINSDVDNLWAEKEGRATIETYQVDGKLQYVPTRPEFKNGPNKLLDLFVFSEAARSAILNADLTNFLETVFENPVTAFQSLSFLYGSEQDIHKDTAYVRVHPPMQLVASWLALEDIEAGSGELEYYVGSHFDEDYLFGGKEKWSYKFPDEVDRYLKSLHEDAQRKGHKREKFLARKGDMLIWHADLAHGGSKITVPGRTRKSLVTHYCPRTAKTFYDPMMTIPWGPHNFTSGVYSDKKLQRP